MNPVAPASMPNSAMQSAPFFKTLQLSSDLPLPLLSRSSFNKTTTAIKPAYVLDSDSDSD